MSENRAQNELVLSPHEYAYTQDLTSGVLKTHTGPGVVNVTGQEYPVNFDVKSGRFRKVNLGEAAQQFVMAQQGQYIVLSNPSVNGKQPDTKSKAMAADLSMGQKLIIQGPATFALWPGQSAEVIDGHNLRSNQYLRIRIRDEQAARENWTKGVIKAAAASEAPAETNESKAKNKAKAHRSSLFEKIPEDLSVGKHYIVRGDEFSFYIPPTGVEVVPDENREFVRDAVTLERLEYCILIDENGNKRYERGPAVVFPQPTERFYSEMSKGVEHIVFQPIELNEIQGLHVKVISDYEENGKSYKEGEELFIRGTETPIYFPRPEHSMVSYDGKHKHFATAVPAGEARYVLARTTGEVKTVSGPTMLLPDPRSEVIVRRVLTDKQCQLWYPGNLEAQKYNAALRSLERGVSSTRGAISEGEVTRSRKIRTSPGASSNLIIGSADKSSVHSDTLAIGAEEFERSATYTEPRTLTLDTKFSGVPTVEVWTGYAVLVVDKRGNRRVEVGPKTVLLGYDETLEVLSLSSGKPKNTDNLLQTVYLRVKNNHISDIFTAGTKDHVGVNFKVSLRGDFTGDPMKWFEAENYVKLVCDHVRSIVKAVVRRMTIEELYADPAGVFRNAVLGEKKEGSRPGLEFAEFGFMLNDVEVLGFNVGDDRISTMLNNTQHNVVEANIGLALSEKKLQIDKRQEELNRERERAKAETQRLTATLSAELEKFNATLASEKIARDLALGLERLESQISQLQKEEQSLAEQQKLLDAKQEAELERKRQAAELDAEIKRALQEIELTRSREETKAVVDRFQAASGPFAEALVALGSQDTMVKVANAMGIQNYVGGPNLVTALKSVFEGTPVASLVQSTINKALPATTNGSEKPVRS